MPDTTPPLTKATVALAGLFLTSGTLHFARPDVFEPIVPVPLRRWSRDLVHASGAAEIVCGVGLLVPSTRRAAGVTSAALLLAVFPANLQMSVSHGRRAARRRDPSSVAVFAGSVARLPLQWPMVRVALRAAGRL